MDGWLLVALIVYGLICLIAGVVLHEWAEGQGWYWRLADWLEEKARGK